jgi:hypothetical protein
VAGQGARDSTAERMGMGWMGIVIWLFFLLMSVIVIVNCCFSLLLLLLLLLFFIIVIIIIIVIIYSSIYLYLFIICYLLFMIHSLPRYMMTYGFGFHGLSPSGRLLHFAN